MFTDEEVCAIARQAESFDEFQVRLQSQIRVGKSVFYHSRVACQLASENEHEKVKWFLEHYRANCDSIVSGYEQAGNNEKACEYRLRGLLDRYIERRRGEMWDTCQTKEYLHCCLFFMFQKSYTQKNKAVKALVLALDGKNVDLVSHLPTLINGRLGQELTQFVNDGHGNHLVGKEVNTLSEFVNALQDNLREVINIKKAR